MARAPQSLPSAPEAMLGGSWKFSITFKEPGAEFKELVNTKATFQPEINKNSLRILQETMGRDGEGKDFLSRLETDIKVPTHRPSPCQGARGATLELSALQGEPLAQGSASHS
jgi:hypothetical protein